MSFRCTDVQKLYENDKKLKREDVDILEEWLKKQPHLPQLEEIQVAGFLHSCYYSIEQAKVAIDKYFTRITAYPDIFYIIPKNGLSKLMSTVFINILPKRTPKGHIIMMIKLLDYKVDNFNFGDTCAMVIMLATLHLHETGPEKGAVALFDGKGFTLPHLTRFNLMTLKHCLEHVQEGAPIRMKAIHFMNMNPIVDKAIAMIKPMLSAEVFKIFQFHSNLDSLYKEIPQELLPEDYGGEQASCKVLNENTQEYIQKNFGFFAWHNEQRVDESKRIGKTEGGLFGVEGTFKKLALD